MQHFSGQECFHTHVRQRVCYQLITDKSSDFQVRALNKADRAANFHVNMRHRPADWGLAVITAGLGQFNGPAGPRPLRPGTIVLTEPRAWMRLRCDPEQPHSMLQVTVCGSAADRVLRRLFGGMDAFPIANVVEVTHLLERMHHEAGNAEPFHQDVLVAQAQTLFHLVARGRLQNSPASSSNERFLYCRRYLEDHADQLTRVADICTACSISRAHLDRLFKHYAHTTPQAYLERRRIMLACKELAQPGQTITSIADRHNWSSPFALSRSFKRIMGISPSHWLAELES